MNIQLLLRCLVILSFAFNPFCIAGVPKMFLSCLSFRNRLGSLDFNFEISVWSLRVEL